MHCLRALQALERLYVYCVLLWPGESHLAKCAVATMLGHFDHPTLFTSCLLLLQTAKANIVPPQGLEQQHSWSDKMKAGYAELKAEGTIGAPTIVYSSRTHSQLAQVMKELRNTSYRCGA